MEGKLQKYLETSSADGQASESSRTARMPGMFVGVGVGGSAATVYIMHYEDGKKEKLEDLFRINQECSFGAILENPAPPRRLKRRISGAIFQRE